MIFKYSFLAIVLLLCDGVFTATPSRDPTPTQILARLLESLKKSQSESKPWYFSEAIESQLQPRVKPIPAPPPAPAIEGGDLPVAWPYPPAPSNPKNVEFPLLERFLKSNGIQSTGNYQNNQISSGSQWNEPLPEQKPALVPAQITWGVQPTQASAPQYIEWVVPQKSQLTPAPTPAPARVPVTQYREWVVPQKSQPTPAPTPAPARVPVTQYREWVVPQKSQLTPAPTPAPARVPVTQYREWGVPQKSQLTPAPTPAPARVPVTQYREWVVPQKSQLTPAPTPAPARVPVTQYREWVVPQKSQPTQAPVPQYIEWGAPQKKPVSSSLDIPAPLNPNENFNIQHQGQNQGQQKHFNIETFRNGGQTADQNNRKDLNVSFIMPPDIRPLSFNFDTGEVQINFGDEKGSRAPIPVNALPNSREYRSQLSLDQIFGTHQTSNAKSQDNTQSNTQPKSQEIDEDEYIVVRHDMSKYAYDLPKGQSVGANPQTLNSVGAQTVTHSSNAQSLGTAAIQTPQVERYDVSGQKNLHFTLGRV